MSEIVRVRDLYGHRQEGLRIELLDLNDAPAGEYTQAERNLSLERSSYARIGAGGLIDVTDDGSVDWLRRRVRVTYLFNDVEYPRGVYLPTTPKGPRSVTGGVRTIELYDKTLVLDEDAVEETYTVAAGVNVVTEVLALVTGAGESATVEESSATTATQASWEPGTSKLDIVNDLLDSIDYVRLYADNEGVLRAQPKVEPSKKPVRWDFRDDDYVGLYLDNFEDELDLFDVPNKVIAIARTDGETPALVSVVTNEDPASPFSQPSRKRWITHVSTDVEATSQFVLDTIAQRVLTDATSKARKLRITHAWLPLELNEVVSFRNLVHGIDGKFRITAIEENLYLPGALMTTTLWEV